VNNLNRVATENGIQDTKWGSRFTSAVTLVLKHIEELYARVDTLDAECSNFYRLLLNDMKREMINVPAQKKPTPSAPGKPLEIMPHQRGEVKRKKRRTPTVTLANVVASVVAAKRQRHGEDDEEEEQQQGGEVPVPGPVTGAAVTKGKRAPRPRKPAREKKTRVLPLPGTVKAEAGQT
jgi:hypothetical protein